MKIGNVEIKNNVVLAPMAGVTDLPFRLLCKEMGCGLLYTEMVSAKAILYNNKNTESLLTVTAGENPISVQLFGSEPQIMADIAKRIEDRPFDIIDVNMGCPVPKVVNNGEGSALMRNQKLVGQIVEAMAKAVKKPVTVKIRSGFNFDSINAPEIAHIVQESGGAAVAVHGRTRGYRQRRCSLWRGRCQNAGADRLRRRYDRSWRAGESLDIQAGYRIFE